MEGKSRTWLGIAAALTLLAGIGTGALLAQDATVKTGDKGTARAGEKRAVVDPAQREARMKLRAERIATFKREFPAAKTSLAAALKGAEESNPGGRAYSVRYGLNQENRLTISVGLVVGDAFGVVVVDPASGRAAPFKRGDGDDDDDEDDDEDDDDDDDEDDEDHDDDDD